MGEAGIFSRLHPHITFCCLFSFRNTMMWHSWHSWHRTPLMIASRVLLSASRHYSLLARLQVLLTAPSAFSLHPMSDPDLWSRSRLTLPCPAAAAEPPPAPLSPYPCHLCSKHKLKMMPHLHVHVIVLSLSCLCLSRTWFFHVGGEREGYTEGTLHCTLHPTQSCSGLKRR